MRIPSFALNSRVLALVGQVVFSFFEPHFGIFRESPPTRTRVWQETSHLQTLTAMPAISSDRYSNFSK
jgi:hypothetical protein